MAKWGWKDEHVSGVDVNVNDIFSGNISLNPDYGITSHYKDGDIECVDYLFDNMPFESFVGGLEWSVKKYLHRWRFKGNPVKDLKKARDYLSVLIDTLEGKTPKFKEWDSEQSSAAG